jgi:sulfate permease, SulP family
MALPPEQIELIGLVAAANPRTVVVVNTASPVTMDWVDDVAAVVKMSYLGQETGAALAAVLFGDADASGRLTTTYPGRIEDAPASPNFPGHDGTVEYAEGVFVGCRHYDTKGVDPRWCFGHGLSYTSFSYSALTVTAAHAVEDPTVALVSLDVTNTGSRPGREVVQVYVRPVDAPVARPDRELKGFDKVALEPGETTTVTVALDWRSFASGTWTVMPGMPHPGPTRSWWGRHPERSTRPPCGRWPTRWIDAKRSKTSRAGTYDPSVHRLERVVPIVGWARSYDKRDLRPDLIAGVTVTALIVPKNLGYAGIAQIPLQNGLYAAAAGALIYAAFGTSRQISTGPSSGLAALAGSAVLATGASQGAEAAALVAAVTLSAGALYLLAGIFRMGWISQFLSKAVVTGFLFGAAIQVVIGELPKLSGTEASGENSWQELRAWLHTIGELDRPTLVVGVVALTTIVGLRFVAPRVPGALVLVVAGIVISSAFDLADRGIQTVGQVPRGLPTLDVPPLQLFQDNLDTIGIAALGLFLIGFSQTAGDARLFASRHQYHVDMTQESVAQGMANVGAGLFQGMPVSTSLSASSLNDSAGAKTSLASITTGVMVLLTLLLLAPVFSDLPKAVLGALIIDAVVFGMIDLPEMRRMWGVVRSDFWIALAALLGVLTVGVLAGVLVGVALSIGWLVYVSSHPTVTELGRKPGTHAFQPLDGSPKGETEPGLLVLRFDAGFSFITADAFEDVVRQKAIDSDERPTRIVYDFAGVNFIDSQGAAKLAAIADLSDAAGISSRFARVKPPVLEVLRLDGLVARVGEDRFHDNIDDAVAAEHDR